MNIGAISVLWRDCSVVSRVLIAYAAQQYFHQSYFSVSDDEGSTYPAGVAIQVDAA